MVTATKRPSGTRQQWISGYGSFITLPGHQEPCVLEDPLRKRILSKLLLLAVVASAPRARAETEAPAQSRTLVVVDAITFITAGLPKTVHDRERFLAIFRRNLTQKGWVTLLQPAEGGCASGNECLSSLARGAGAPYALRITGEGNLVRGYTLHFSLYAPGTKRSQRATAYCDICLTDRMAGIASDFALRLIDDVAQAEQEEQTEQQRKQRASSGAGSEPAKKPPLAAATAEAVQAAPRPAASSMVPFVSWTMVGVGVLAMGYGGWALYKNGGASGDRQVTSTQTLARDKYSTTALGATSLAIGGALAVVGVILVSSQVRPRDGVSLATTADGLSLRF